MNKKFEVLRFLIVFAISQTFLFVPIELKSCSENFQRIGSVLKKGKLYGLKIYGFQRDNVLRYVGFRKNDIILEVNGNKIWKLLEQDTLNQSSAFKEDFKKNRHLKIKLQRKKSFYELEFILNAKNISKMQDSHCSGYEIDPSIPKNEMFDFYEMKKVE